MNVKKIIDKCQVKLNSWLLRDISLLGRIFLTKMESISRLIYPAYTISNRDIKKSIRFILVTSGKRRPITLKK